MDVLTDIMLFLMATGLVAAIAVVAWSTILTVRNRIKSGKNGEDKALRRVALSIVVGTLIVLLLAILLSSADALSINGKPYENALWLRLADVFTISAGILLVVAVLSLLLGWGKSFRIKS